MLATLDCPARPKMGRPRKPTATTTVRLNVDIAEKARLIAALRRIEVSEYLSKVLASIVERDYKTERRKLASEEE